MFTLKDLKLKLIVPATVISMLLVGCAKELPEDISEDIEMNVHSVKLFDSEVVIETIDDEQAEKLSIQADEEISGFFSLNSKKLRKVKVVNAPKELEPFFRDLRIESTNAGETFKVTFKLTENYLVAYANVEGKEISEHNQEILKQNKIPLFQYPVASYGVLQKAENDLGEQTRRVIFMNQNKSNSTHVRIDPTIEGRILSGLRAKDIDPTETVVVKNKINNKVISVRKLKSFLTNHNIVDVEKLISNDDLVKLKVHKEKIYIMLPKHKKDLSEIERTFYSQSPRDHRIADCGKKMAERVRIPENKCVVTSAYSVSVEQVKLKLDTDNNQSIATTTFSTDVNPNRARLLKLNREEQIKKARIGEDINLVDKILTSKQKDYDLDATYLYVPMTGSTPRGVTEADPFYQGKEKLVKLKFEKDGLSAFEFEKDPRFSENQLNDYPVFTIPGEHFDVKCKEDENDECTDGDTVNNDITWDKKRFFIPTPKNIKLYQINPLDLWSVGGNSCVNKVGSELVKHTIKKGVLFFEIENTYRKNTSFRCIIWDYFDDTEEFTGLKSTSFKTRFTYSLVKIDDLASKDYEEVNYPTPDHNVFGYFTTRVDEMDSHYDRDRVVKKYKLSRWNPKKKTIVYHLSDTFNEPDQKVIKDATYKAVAGMNKALEKANAGIQIKLMEPSGKSSGDLRYNVIQLITDPLDNGLLGYAPTVTNPLTGEIVQGHINMYSGVLKSMSRRVWNSMADLSVEQLEEAKKEVNLESIIKEDQEHKNHDHNNSKFNNPNVAAKIKNADINYRRLIESSLQDNSLSATHMLDRRLQTRISDSLLVKEKNEIEEKIQKTEERLDRWSRNNAYAVEFFPIGGTVKAIFPEVKKVEGVFKEDGTLKTWDELTGAQKDIVGDIMIKYTYTSTLIHEFGHGLGLRHNFQGSFDKDNFYTEEEAAELGLRAAPAYSSIMDYARSSLNELTAFGKYDIAALRFGYAREIEVVTDEENGTTEFVKIPNTAYDLEQAGAEFKSYGYCTDENAGLSSSCYRFDEGTSLVEIAKSRIKLYKDNYKYRNFRNGKNTFKDSNLGRYVVSRYYEFNNIRDIFEEWEFFAGIFGEQILVDGCNAQMTQMYPICKTINDYSEAVKIVGDFFIEVIKTPDFSCVVRKAPVQNEDGTTTESPIEFKKMYDIYDDIKWGMNYVPSTCFDEKVKEKLAEDGYTVIAEGGKFLNGFKDTDPNYNYADDRYALGIWADKFLAMKSLFQREQGRPTSDRNFGALIDHPSVQEKFSNILFNIFLEQDLTETVKFKTEDGSKVEIPYSLNTDELINGPLSGAGWLREFFGMSHQGKTNLTKVMLNQAPRFGLTGDEELSETSRSLINFFTVRKNDIDGDISNEDISKLKISETIYGAHTNNTLARKMIDSYQSLDFLKTLEPTDVAESVQRRSNPPMPADLDEELKVAYTLADDLLAQLVSLSQQGAELDLEYLISILGTELGTQVFNAYQLGTEKLMLVVSIKQKQSQAPADASDEIKELYKIDLDIVMEFLEGKLQEKTEKYLEKIELMPKHLLKKNK